MVTSKLYTANDLWNLPSTKQFELIEGDLREVSPAGQRASKIAGDIFFFLRSYLQSHPIGILTGADGGYVITKDPDTVLAPDVGFARFERLPGGKVTDGFTEVAPDLAVEVVSPSDRRTEIEQKQDLYDRAGVSIVWWVYPKERLVKEFRGGGRKPTSFGIGYVISGHDVLPGFELKIADIFKE